MPECLVHVGRSLVERREDALHQLRREARARFARVRRRCTKRAAEGPRRHSAAAAAGAVSACKTYMIEGLKVRVNPNIYPV